MYALAVQNIPEGNKWLYEVKFDGYRCIAGKRQNGVTLWSRRGNDFTPQFPRIAQACERLPADTLLDGEIVAIDQNGRISFNLLQHHRSRASAMRFYAFDLLYDRGKSLLRLPLIRRRELLKNTVTALSDPVLLSETFETEPSELVSAARELNLEGVIAKRKDSPYESGKRSGAWLKYRINRGQEFVIGGYVPNNPLDSIIVGYYQGEKLLYAGKVRNGFVAHTRKEVFQRLKDLQTAPCPFANLPERKRTQWALTREEMKNCLWVKPELVVQIEFGEWTPDGHLRHSRFLALRDDKNPHEVIREILTGCSRSATSAP